MKLFEIAENPATPGNVDGAFTVGKVKFDNERGLGATPAGQNIMYRGAVAFIKPSIFRKFALAADRSDTSKGLVDKMKKGTAIAVPWLDIEVHGDDASAPEKVSVTGHEGRARADAFMEINGDVPMPVQLQLRYIRARNLSPEFFTFIEKNGMTVERSDEFQLPHAEKYFWDGKTIGT